MWGDQETAAAMEYYSESYTEPKLIDFFKCEAPLRKDHGGVGELTYVCRPGIQQLGSQGNGAAQELPAIADGGRSLKLEPPSGILVDFLSGNGDDPNHQLAVSRSSSDETTKHPMAPRWIREAVTGDQWSLITARPSVPDLALKLLSPSPTGTQASGTSPPKTPTFDVELNSRTRSAQPCTVTSIPDHEGESSTFSADSDRRVLASFFPDASRNSQLHMKEQFNGKPGSRVHRWSPKNGQKRLKIRDDDAAMVQGSNVEDRPHGCSRKVRAKDEDEEKEAVVQAAASLLSLSSNDDDWQPTPSTKTPILPRPSSALQGVTNGPGGSSTKKPTLRRSGSSASASALATKKGDEDRNVSLDGETKSGESGSIVGCSSGSVLSRPSNKRRYRLVVDVLAESPRVR